MKPRGRWFATACVTACALLLAVACSDDDDSAPQPGPSTTASSRPDGGRVRFAAEQEPSSLNWLAADTTDSWTQYIMQLVWPSTVNVLPDGSLEPNEEFATWELTSTDPQVITYRIDPAAVWSDGTPVTVEDFRFTWEAQNGRELGTERDPETGELLPRYHMASTSGFDQIESVEQGADEREVVVTYARPYADWRVVFDPVLPKHAFEELGGGDPAVGFNEGFRVEGLDVSKVPSANRYMVQRLDPGQGLMLVRNPTYWGTPGTLGVIDFPYVTEASEQPSAFANGEIDGGYPQAQIDLVERLKQLPGAQSEVGMGTLWEHLDFNASNPLMADVRVRKAIAKAIDRQLIVDTLPGKVTEDAQVLGNRIYFPGSPYYEDHGRDYQRSDLDAVGELLTDAGFAKGGDGVWARDGQRLAFRLAWAPQPNERRQATAELIASQLREAGMDVTVDARSQFGFIPEGDWEVVLFGWTGGTSLSASESLYVTGGGQNHGKIPNPEVTELFPEANVELDPDDRAATMNRIDELLWENMHSLPLFQVPEIVFWRSGIENVVYNGFDGVTWNAFRWTAA